jgi:hypothetical protein
MRANTKSLSRRLTIVTLLAMGAWPSPATAQEIPRWDVTAAGGIAWDDLTNAISLSIGAHIGRHVVVEAELLRIDNLFSSNSSTSLRAYWLGGNVVVTTGATGSRFFAVAGIGAGHTTEEWNQGSAALTSMAFNFGGGMIVPVSRRVWVRGDFRVLILDGGGDPLYVKRLTAGVGFGF